MAIRCTITKAGVVNEYGQALAIGTVYTPNNDDYALALISQGKATDTDDFLGERVNAPFDEVVYPLDPVGLSTDGTSLVSGDGTIISMAPTLMTLAAMLAYAPTTDGVEVYVTDLPSGTRGRFYWHLASSKWRPAGMVLIDRSLTLDSGVNNTSEQYIKNVSVPAGLLFTGCEIYIEYTLARSNTTDAGAAAQFRIGNAGTIADAVTSAGSGFANLSSTTRSFGNSHRYRVVSATQLQKIGTPTPVASSFANSSSSLAADTLLTVGDTTARLYFAPTVQLAAATGTTLPQVGYSALWLLPS